MKYIKLFIDVLILAIVFIFFAQNYEVLQYPVQLQMSFFFTSPYLFPPIPLYMLSLFIFIFAVIIVLLIVGKETIYLRFTKRKLERIIKEQEAELIALRTLPLKDTMVSQVNIDKEQPVHEPQ